MLCPYCGKEMRKGYIQAASYIIFSEKTPVKAYSSNAQDIQIAEQTLVPAAVSAYYCTR
ncbi:MAG: PF20097 family protein [[Clostridium] innocuum]